MPGWSHPCRTNRGTHSQSFFIFGEILRSAHLLRQAPNYLRNLTDSSSHVPYLGRLMSRRREKRSFLAVPVRVSGSDARGRSFRHGVCTLDLSAKGARITSLQSLTMNVGQELTLEHQRDRVRFEIVWIGAPGTAREG